MFTHSKPELPAGGGGPSTGKAMVPPHNSRQVIGDHVPSTLTDSNKFSGKDNVPPSAKDVQRSGAQNAAPSPGEVKQATGNQNASI